MPLARASAISFCTRGITAAQRARCCGVQVLALKSMLIKAVFFGSSVTSLSDGGGGGLIEDHSSKIFCAPATVDDAARKAPATARTAMIERVFIVSSPRSPLDRPPEPIPGVVGQDLLAALFR